MVAIGAAVGSLIGLTGIGSGSLLTPLLLLLGHLSPATAVGTSLVFSFVTKIYGSWNFYQRRFVRMDIVGDLCLGGLPGVLGGTLFLRYLDVHRPQFLDVFLSHAIGVVLVVISAIMLVRLLPLRALRTSLDRGLSLANGHRRILIVLIGMGVGLSVGLTSIGSGAALIPAMVLFYRLDSGTLVGTNIFVGAILSGVATVPHLWLGHIDARAVVGLLCGSVPALWLSSQVHGGLPRAVTEIIVGAAILLMGLHIMAV
jgi:uncharacterized protein